MTHARRSFSAAESDPPSRITLVLPENPQYDAGDEPKDWDFATEPGMAHSQYIISDKPKTNASNKRARKLTASSSNATFKLINCLVFAPNFRRDLHSRQGHNPRQDDAVHTDSRVRSKDASTRRGREAQATYQDPDRLLPGPGRLEPEDDSEWRPADQCWLQHCSTEGVLDTTFCSNSPSLVFFCAMQ